MKLRGHLAIALVLVMLGLSDLVQRFVIGPIVWLFPSRRIPVFTAWQKLMAAFVLEPVKVIGGAHIAALPTVPAREGTLVLMNHQSVLDIPLVVSVLQGRYPRIVTRARYGRWIPLISHMTRLYQYPIVEPGGGPAALKRSLERIEHAAGESDVPIVVFPEGTRTRDGRIGAFKTAGLERVLAARAWRVHLVVADGFWERAKLKDFLGGTAQIEGRVDVAGPFAWDDPTADPTAFIGEMRTRMIDMLAELRAGQPA